jgi:hypothetical protein
MELKDGLNQYIKDNIVSEREVIDIDNGLLSVHNMIKL